MHLLAAFVPPSVAAANPDLGWNGFVLICRS